MIRLRSAVYNYINASVVSALTKRQRVFQLEGLKRWNYILSIVHNFRCRNLKSDLVNIISQINNSKKKKKSKTKQKNE